MRAYEKIETIFNRDIEGSKQLIPGSYRNPTVEYLKDNEWIWLEKVDGTNISVDWDGHKVSFYGRTERAIIPDPLLQKLEGYFGGEENAQIFEQLFGDKHVILYGEGYGEKIQNGGGYMFDGHGVDFILFDLLVENNFQMYESMQSCARSFGIKTVPIVGHGTLSQAVAYVKTHPKSTLGNRLVDMEGVVCRPAIELNSRCHNRVIVKIKYHDFKDI